MAESPDARDRADNSPRVAPLGRLDDFQVAEGYPDPRGWDVVAADGMKVGEVHDLIVDTGAMRTRYLDVRLDTDIAGEGDDRDVLVPIGAARMNDTGDHVLLDHLSTAQVAALPVYTHGHITREFEGMVLGAMPAHPTMPAAAPASDFYSTHHFDESGFFAPQNAGRPVAPPSREALDTNDTARLVRSEEELSVGKREVPAGEVGIHKTVETERVSRPVTLRHDEVTIERRPVSADRAASGSTEVVDTGDEIRIPVIEEEVVVEKRQVVKEEIVIRKHAVSEEKTVEADLRRERIDVNRTPASDADRPAS